MFSGQGKETTSQQLKKQKQKEDKKWFLDCHVTLHYNTRHPNSHVDSRREKIIVLVQHLFFFFRITIRNCYLSLLVHFKSSLPFN